MKIWQELLSGAAVDGGTRISLYHKTEGTSTLHIISLPGKEKNSQSRESMRGMVDS